MTCQGLLLAAGAGRRMGGPKALLRDDDGTTYAARAVKALRRGGCAEVTVVVGAAADEVVGVLDGLGVDVVLARDWAEGMGASLRAGLTSLGRAPDACLVTLVDLPDVVAAVVERVLATGIGPDALARACYAGVVGHPVLLGREHWDGVRAAASGDRGARDYLAVHEPDLVECGDLATGVDVDHPPPTR